MAVRLFTASLSLFLLCFLRCPDARAASGPFGKIEQAKPAFDSGVGAKGVAKKGSLPFVPFAAFSPPEENQFRNQFSYFALEIALPSLARVYAIRTGLSPPAFS